MIEWIWVFHGEGGRFSSAVFSCKEKAEAWIVKHGLSGVLTKMPIDQSVYDWAVAQDVFRPKRADQTTASFIQKFSSASLEHYHYD